MMDSHSPPPHGGDSYQYGMGTSDGGMNASLNDNGNIGILYPNRFVSDYGRDVLLLFTWFVISIDLNILSMGHIDASP